MRGEDGIQVGGQQYTSQRGLGEQTIREMISYHRNRVPSRYVNENVGNKR